MGEKLGHSYSPQIHKYLASYEYLLYEKGREEVTDFLKNGAFDALNVTIPYKKVAFAACDRLSDTAKRLGSVNTIVRGADGKLFGHNTDYYGFRYTVQSSGIAVQGKKAVVMGNGGVSSTVVAVLEDLGAAKIVVVDLNLEDNYTNIDRHFDAHIIVNATPVGMYPHNGNKLVDLALFTNCIGVFDLIYNPSKTALLLQAETLGIPHRNGLAMLVAQAKESAEYFADTKIAETKIQEILEELEREMKNIVLIGMPGCGKSTVGRALAQKLGREFVDADEALVKRYGPIPEIFKTKGEDAFRKMETEVLSDLGRQKSLVIATGGGCVTREENYPLLHQNGQIIWIERDIAALPTDGRPISQSTALSALYALRKPLYERFADKRVQNDSSVEKVVEEIL